ncbi:MAG: toll/interleukin-1 receptor domain-containing protein [Vicinamibacterales bacterium]
MPHDVFVSYATEDKLAADAVCARLEQQGIRCWIAPRDILPGAGWKASIVGAIEDARALVLVFTAHSNASPEVAKEIAQAAQHGQSIVTFRLEDVPLARALKYDLDGVHWLDAVTPPLERHIDHLGDKLRVLLDKVPPPQRPPVAMTPGATQSSVPRGLLVVGAIAVLLASAAIGWMVARGSAAPTAATAALTPTPTEATPPPARPTQPVPPPVEPLKASPSGPVAGRKRTGETPAGPAAQGETPVPAASPAPAAPVSPPPDRAPAADAPSAGDNAELRAIGCWQDPRSPGILQIRADGSYVSGGVLTGKWIDLDRVAGAIILQFADEVGQAQLSVDGRSLALTGLVNDTLTRAKGSAALPGAWAFSNGQAVAIEADGTFRTARLTARWRVIDAASRQYAVIWPGMRPSTSASADGQSMTLSDSRYGFVWQFQRRPCASQ